MDQTKTYYLVADINTNVNNGAINTLTLTVGTSKIRATNGSISVIKSALLSFLAVNCSTLI
jgi:hypothetical protein